MSQEQSYIGTENAVQTPAGKEFLQNYELRGWQLSPRIYKILGVSVLANLLFFGVAGQTSLLTMKGCESPFVGRVCQVLDTVYVGAVLFGTDREFVDASYERIDLGEADITFVDVTGQTGPIDYPEGYFQIANPEQFAAMQAANENPTFGFNPTTPVYTPPPPVGGGVLSRAPRLPKANPNAVKGDDLDSPFKVEDEVAGTDPTRGGNTPPLGNANTNGQVANANTNPQPVNPTDPLALPEMINRRPLVDLSNMINDERAKNQLDLQSEFELSARGKLDKNGRLDPKNFRYIKASGEDERMINIVKASIEAVNVAGYLQYLRDLTGKDLFLDLSQNETDISAVIQSEVETESRAKAIKSTLELGISIAKNRKLAENADQNDKDDLVLLEGAKVEVEGKRVIIRFVVPKDVAHPMIERKLAEQANEAKKPNGNAGMRPADRTAAK